MTTQQGRMPAGSREQAATDHPDRSAHACGLRWWARWREPVRRYRSLDVTWRIVVGLVGGAIILVGALLLPLPGPGWLVVFVGLGVLASEFTWARRLLHFARSRVRQWTRRANRLPRIARMAFGVSVLVAVAAAVVGYLAWYGVPASVPLIG